MASVGGAIGLTNQFNFKETYDKLKEAEQKDRMTRPRERIDSIEAKQKDIKELITHLNTIKTTASDILSSKVIGQKNLKTEGDSAKITISRGIGAMNFKLDVKQLALKDTYQSAAIDNEEAPLFSRMIAKFTDDDGKEQDKVVDKASFIINVANEKFTIHIDSATSLSQLADKLKSAKTDDGKSLKDFVNIKVIDTGKDGIRLMLGASKSGVENALSFDIAGEDSGEKAASLEALKRLGFASSVQENKALEKLKAAKDDEKLALKIINAQEFDVNGFKDKLGDEVIKLKTAKNEEFSIDKTSDIMNLSDEQLDAFYEYKTQQDALAWAIDNGVKVSINNEEKPLNTNDAKNLSKEQLTEISEKYFQSTARDWLSYVKSSADFKGFEFESAEASSDTAPAESSTEASGKKKLKVDSSTTWENMSDELKGLFIDKYKSSLKAAFNSQAKLAKAQSEYELKSKLAANNHIQKASDAEFSYDGVMITRAENDIKDLVIGADIKLLKTGKMDVSLSPDSSELIKHLDEFVGAFNSFMNNFNAATDFDDKSHKAKGSLIGVSEVQTSRNRLVEILNKISDGGYSLSRLGLSINKGGILEFNKSIFEAEYAKDSNAVEKFLLGGTDYKEFSHTGNKISTMPVIASGDLVINDKKVSLDADFIKRLNQIGSDGKVDRSLALPSQDEYNAALLKAIKDADIAGISARINQAGALVLSSDGKQSIDIKGIDDKLKGLGLSEINIKASGKVNKGIFDNVKDLINDLTADKGILSNYDHSLSEETKNLKKDLDDIKESIDKRFDVLRAKLVRYDVLIHKMDLQGKMIDGMMKAAFSKKD